MWPWAGAVPPSPLIPTHTEGIARHYRAKDETVKGAYLVLRVEGNGPKGHGRPWGLGLGRLPWALSGEDGVPLEAERGRVWGEGRKWVG